MILTKEVTLYNVMIVVKLLARFLLTRKVKHKHLTIPSLMNLVKF